MLFLNMVNVICSFLTQLDKYENVNIDQIYQMHTFAREAIQEVSTVCTRSIALLNIARCYIKIDRLWGFVVTQYHSYNVYCYGPTNHNRPIHIYMRSFSKSVFFHLTFFLSDGIGVCDHLLDDSHELLPVRVIIVPLHNQNTLKSPETI